MSKPYTLRFTLDGIEYSATFSSVIHVTEIVRTIRALADRIESHPVRAALSAPIRRPVHFWPG